MYAPSNQHGLVLDAAAQCSPVTRRSSGVIGMRACCLQRRMQLLHGGMYDGPWMSAPPPTTTVIAEVPGSCRQETRGGAWASRASPWGLCVAWPQLRLSVFQAARHNGSSAWKRNEPFYAHGDGAGVLVLGCQEGPVEVGKGRPGPV